MKIVKPGTEILLELDSMSVVQRIERCWICDKSDGKITAISAKPFVANSIKRNDSAALDMAVVTLRVKVSLDFLIMDFLKTNHKHLVIDWLNFKEMLITGSMGAFRELFMECPDDEVVNSLVAVLSMSNPVFFEDLNLKRVDHSPCVTVSKVELEELDDVAFDYEMYERHRFVAVKFVVSRAVCHELARLCPCSAIQEAQPYRRTDKDKFGYEVTFVDSASFECKTTEGNVWLQSCIDAERRYLAILVAGKSLQAASVVLTNSFKAELILFASLDQWQRFFQIGTGLGADASVREVMAPLMTRFHTTDSGQGNGAIDDAA
nr:hypothetical protein 7 [Deltaproteobacteria bacterium]